MSVKGTTTRATASLKLLRVFQIYAAFADRPPSAFWLCPNLLVYCLFCEPGLDASRASTWAGFGPRENHPTLKRARLVLGQLINPQTRATFLTPSSLHFSSTIPLFSCHSSLSASLYLGPRPLLYTMSLSPEMRVPCLFPQAWCGDYISIEGQ
jgi:hypothetical protein